MSPEAFRINLDPASVLYLGKLALRKRDGIPRDAIELPRFAWSLDKQRLPGITDRDIVKNFMRALASAWRAMQTRPDDDGFVALVRLTSTPDRFDFEMHCPYEQVLAPLAEAAARKKLVDHPSVAGLDIQHKYALMDARCPVVFMWRHKTQDVLITNEYHTQNPQQFLAIDRVGTTSGFLNFIGALNLMSAMGEEMTYTKQLPLLMRDAMAARADEWLRWFHHHVDERVIFERRRLFVDPRHPESYFYDYSGRKL